MSHPIIHMRERRRARRTALREQRTRVAATAPEFEAAYFAKNPAYAPTPKTLIPRTTLWMSDEDRESLTDEVGPYFASRTSVVQPFIWLVDLVAFPIRRHLFNRRASHSL